MWKLKAFLALVHLFAARAIGNDTTSHIGEGLLRAPKARSKNLRYYVHVLAVETNFEMAPVRCGTVRAEGARKFCRYPEFGLKSKQVIIDETECVVVRSKAPTIITMYVIFVEELGGHNPAPCPPPP